MAQLNISLPPPKDSPDFDGWLSQTTQYLRDYLGLYDSSAEVDFIQSGTGAVTRTMQDKMRDIKSILDFGVVGDGTTDDTVAFQAAINATKGIATLYLPLGKTYKLKNLTIYKGTHIVSDGPGYTTAPNLLFTAAGKDDSYGIKVDDGDGENIVLKGFTIEGDGTDSVAGFYIPSGKTMYYSDIDIGIKNFQYGCYCVGTLWSSSVKLYVEKAYIGMVRTADAYNTSLDLNLRIFRCFHGVLFHNTTYCQMWGFMEDCGLTAAAYLPAAWKPADEAPICVSMYGGQLTINYLGTENTNAIYIEATGYANVKCSSLYAASLPADTWIYDAARNDNIAGDDQGLFSVHDGGFISLDNFTFAHLNADGYEIPANVLSYMFRIDAAPSSISVSNEYINIQDYWLVDLEERFMWDGSGNIIATMDDGRVFGVWTPVLTTDTVDFTSVTYHADTFGTYRKNGNVVFFNGRIRTTAVTVGSASGGLMITGIPLTPADATNPVLVSNATGFAATVPISAYLNSSGNIFPQYRANPDGVTSFCVYTTVSATNNDIFFSGSYLV